MTFLQTWIIRGFSKNGSRHENHVSLFYRLNRKQILNRMNLQSLFIPISIEIKLTVTFPSLVPTAITFVPTEKAQTASVPIFTCA